MDERAVALLHPGLETPLAGLGELDSGTDSSLVSSLSETDGPPRPSGRGRGVTTPGENNPSRSSRDPGRPRSQHRRTSQLRGPNTNGRLSNAENHCPRGCRSMGVLWAVPYPTKVVMHAARRWAWLVAEGGVPEVCGWGSWRRGSPCRCGCAPCESAATPGSIGLDRWRRGTGGRLEICDARKPICV